MNETRTTAARTLQTLVAALFAFATLVSVAQAERRPHEGKIVKLDSEAKMMTVAGEKNDEWTLYWTETTKLKGVTAPELAVGDSVHFDYVEKDGKMWLTELRRTHKAGS
jgi:hypothetical protein